MPVAQADFNRTRLQNDACDVTPDQVSAAVRRCGLGCHAERLCCRSITLALVRPSIAVAIVRVNVPIDDRLADRIDDDQFDIRPGYARDRPGFGFSVLQDGLRDVISVSDALLVGVAGAHGIAAIIEDQAHEQGRIQLASLPRAYKPPAVMLTALT